MELKHYSSSKSYFNLFEDIDQPVICSWHSLKGRFLALKIFFEFLLVLPFGLGYKLYKTFFRGVGLFFSGALLLLTLGSSSGLREFFVRRVSSLAYDLADWVLLPFAVFSCFCRLLLASLVHPSLFLRF